MSSIIPLVAQQVGAACVARGIGFLDASVSGGELKAADDALFHRMLPIFGVLGSSATLNGGAGDLDHAAIVTWSEQMAGCEVRKPS